MKQAEASKNAKKFLSFWESKGYEKGETASFWRSLLHDVFKVEDLDSYIEFERHLSGGFIDAYIPSTKVLIEQKGSKIDLSKPQLQSDGANLTPYQQAKRYADLLPNSERPRWIIACNFKEFHIHDLEHPQNDAEIVYLKDLPRDYHRLGFLVDANNENIKVQEKISFKAGDIIGKLYDALLKQYRDPESPETLKSLNKLCVRIVFCLYAEDAGLFTSRNYFHSYLSQFDYKHVRNALIDLFRVLNTKEEERDPYIEESLAKFPYVNGGLFADENIEIPTFTQEIVSLILREGSENFDWSQISPTVFGSLFESTLNPVTRSQGGMHYTSVENIHKVIEPLFLNDLRKELNDIRALKTERTRIERLKAYQDKLASLKFLDPACGSGNFLTETYLCLRKLENEVLSILTHGQMTMGDIVNPIKVSISQFYGIEINDFAVSVAQAALWIAESQMRQHTAEIVYLTDDYLPLKSFNHIIEGNALTIDWETVVPKEELSYIIGNPPFLGARLMGKEQKQELISVFGPKWKNAGNLDYVSCWYKKASDFMKGTQIHTALVSTNSISQGDPVSILWKPLIENGASIEFAYPTFQWDSEANIKAHVHCVIIGFSMTSPVKNKILFTENGAISVKNINPYLMDAPNIFIESRNLSICPSPKMGIGNKPIDGGNYLFTKDEMEQFVKEEPLSKPYFRKWLGAREFINRIERFCLWLGDCTPSELRKMPKCAKRVQAVRDFRLASTSAGTVKLADTPTRFHVENMPEGNYILIPRVSSEKRKYIPMDYVSPSTLSSDSALLVIDAELFHFGVMTSSTHMIWTRAVCGRLETRLRYSKDIVYNNFPWCNPSDSQKKKIEKTAQAILDARASDPDSSLADLYDDPFMPEELRKAHVANDKAVLEAYGFNPDISEKDLLAKLFNLYEKEL